VGLGSKEFSLILILVSQGRGVVCNWLSWEQTKASIYVMFDILQERGLWLQRNELGMRDQHNERQGTSNYTRLVLPLMTYHSITLTDDVVLSRVIKRRPWSMRSKRRPQGNLLLILLRVVTNHIVEVASQSSGSRATLQASKA
jgi:hypothetical protein